MCLVYLFYFTCFKIDLNRLQGWNSYTINREYNRPFRSCSVAFLWKIPHLEGRNKRLACLRVKRERRKDKVLKSQLRAPYCFTRVTHQEIRWRTNTGNCGLRGEKGVSGWTWAWLLFTRLWRNTLNQIFPTQAHKVPMLTLVPMVLMKAPIWDSSAMTYSWLKKLTLLRKTGLDSYVCWKFNEMQKRALCLSENSARSGFISLWIIIYTKPLAKS